MKYDFESMIDRRGKDALAVDSIPYEKGSVKEGFSKIPMWVADMSFATAPSVTKALEERIQHPLYGYFEESDEYYDSIISWQRERNGVCGLKKENIGYENGVLGGVVAALRVFCQQGDKVLVHSPTYIGFTKSLENNGFKIIHSPLKKDESGRWTMDYDDMREKLKKEQIHAAILCSPHNPCGRVWTREELEKAMEIYKENDVFVISDEIWSDILLNGHEHIPTQSVSEDAKMRTVALYAPSKTFNLAGLVGSYHIVYNSYIHDRMKKESSLSHYNSCNVMSMHALIGAYSAEGAEWTEELRQTLSGNVNYAYDFITSHFKGVELFKPEGTYMLFIDCEKFCRERGMSLEEVLKKGVEVGVIWQDGRPFHGEYSIRMNLALPGVMLEEALDRLDKYVFSYNG